MFGSNNIHWRVLCCQTIPTAVRATQLVVRLQIPHTLVRFPAEFTTTDLRRRCATGEMERCLASGNCTCNNLLLTGGADVFVPTWNSADPKQSREVQRVFRPSYIAHPTNELVVRAECPCHADNVEFVDVGNGRLLT